MGLIEQAAKRLEELRRAGIEVDEAEKPGSLHAVNPRATVEPAPRIVSHATRVEINLSALAAKGFVTP